MKFLKKNEEEHEKIKDLVGDVEGSKDEDKKEVFKRLYMKVYAHNDAEDTAVFPLLKEFLSKDKHMDRVLFLEEEHKLINYQLAMLMRTQASNDTWDAKFKLLKKLLQAHTSKEEEKLAKYSKKNLTKDQLKELTKLYEESYQESKDIKIEELNIDMSEEVNTQA